MSPPNPTPPAQIRLNLRLPAIWLIVALIAAFLLPDRVWNTLLIGLGGLFIIAYSWARLLANGLHATRKLRFGWVSVGDRLSEQFEIHNDSIVPALWVEIRDASNVPGYNASIVRSLGERDVNRWRQAAICQRRGQYQLGPWEIRSGDAFGIFTVIRHYPVSEEIIIHPPIYGRLPITLPTGASDGRIRAPRHRYHHTATATTTIRDYRPQDPLRLIHWPSSARRDQLFVREFDPDVSGDIWLLLDMEQSQQIGSGPDGTEEHTVLLAASLTARAIRQNRAVGLAAYGQTPQTVPPGSGQGQQWRILRALALTRADGTIPLTRALRDIGDLARRGTTVVVITPTSRADWLPELAALARRGVQSSVVVLDRPSFGGSGNAQPLADAVRQLGFAAHILAQGALGDPLIETQRRGFWEFQVTGTGRVITVSNPLQDGAPQP